ncbi:MAG: ABC transporter substrate-binding protein [Oscillospiraceae bacterium]|nr:ABC transporter substrate-binding protein [Oscillospiraceae bacterium]
MKKFVFVLALLLVLCACGRSPSPAVSEDPLPPSSPSPAKKGETAFTDALGQELCLTAAPGRVAVLGGSLAEVWVLAGGSLAAVTSDAWEERGMALPPDVLDLGGQQEPSAELLFAADPDLVIANAAVAGHTALAQQLSAAGITTAYFDIENFEDYLAMLRICCALTGRDDLYRENGAAVEEQVSAQRARAEGRDSPSVLLLRASSTGIKVKNSQNNMAAAMLKDLGCRNLADSDLSLLETVSMEKIIAADPDYIFVTIMGSPDQAMAALEETLVNDPAWSALSAVQNGHYTVLPKELFHYKPNNRWGEAYEILADILYPAQ